MTSRGDVEMSLWMVLVARLKMTETPFLHRTVLVTSVRMTTFLHRRVLVTSLKMTEPPFLHLMMLVAWILRLSGYKAMICS